MSEDLHVATDAGIEAPKAWLFARPGVEDYDEEGVVILSYYRMTDRREPDCTSNPNKEADDDW